MNKTALLLSVLIQKLFVVTAFAQIIQQGLDDAAAGSGLPTAFQGLQPTIGNFIRAAVLLVGALGMAAVVAAGVMLIVSWGSENMKERAKKAIIYAAAGIALIFFAYVTVKFFLEELV